jgi:peptidyl-prolyl cis-trans isomerase D
MLTKIREKFAGGVAIVILGAIAVSFVFFGTNMDFSGGNAYAAKVDGSKISVNEFETDYRARLEADQRLASLPPEIRVQLRRNVLDALVRERLVDLYLDDAGYQVSEAVLDESIQRIPEFQVDGVFDLATAEALLQQNSYTIKGFRAAQRRQMRLSQLQRAIGATALVTPAEYRRYLNLIAEQRLVSVAEFDLAAAAGEVTVSYEEIAAYYADNDSLYLLPESATIEYIELNRSSLADRVAISEEALNDYYRDSQNRYLQDEQRRASHILIPFDDDEAAAEETARALLARLNAGEPFADLAKANSKDGGTAAQGGDLGTLTRSQLPGELGAEIFSMQAGQISGPVRSEFGFHIVRVSEILAQGPLPLDQVRGELLSELRERETEGLYRDLSRKASDALFDNPDMQAIASATGLEVQRADDVQRSNAGPYGSNQAAIDAIFSDSVLNGGATSELIEIDANRSAIFKVVAHSPASRQSLDEVRDQVLASVREQKAAAIVFDRASQLMQALDSGEEFASAAEAAGAAVSAPKLLGRQSTDLDRTVMAEIFSAPKPSQDAPVRGQVANEDGSYTVFSLEAVLPGRPESIPQADRFAGKEQLAQQAGGSDYLAFVQSLVEQADIDINDSVVAASDLLQ